MTNSRKIKLNKKYTPLEIRDGDEFYPNGIFNFNISKILEHIESGKIVVEKETIDVKEWFKGHMHSSVNEDHLPTVDVTKPIILGEIRPGGFNIIDGNHRMEKARRQGLAVMESYKLYGEQLIPYFKEVRGYEAFVDYWNEKVKMDVKFGRR